MNVTRNPFFKLALARAAKLAGTPGRLIKLLAQLSVKIYRTPWKSVTAEGIKNEFLLLGRLLKAHVSGTYKIQSLKLLLTLVAAVIYFVNPFDLIPDMILGVGLTDDFAILAWVYRTAAVEIDSFKAWEAGSKATD